MVVRPWPDTQRQKSQELKITSFAKNLRRCFYRQRHYEIGFYAEFYGRFKG